MRKFCRIAATLPLLCVAFAQGSHAPCYSCFFKANAQTDLVQSFREYNSHDPLVSGDIRMILWRATGTPDCGALEDYHHVADDETNVDRRLQAFPAIGFTAPECKQDASKAF